MTHISRLADLADPRTRRLRPQPPGLRQRREGLVAGHALGTGRRSRPSDPLSAQESFFFGVFFTHTELWQIGRLPSGSARMLLNMSQ